MRSLRGRKIREEFNGKQAYCFRSLTLIVSLVLGLIVAEVVSRVLLPDFTLSDRYLFFSSSHFRLDGTGAVRYIPNETVRMVTVYGEQIEVDVTYRTNEEGFIDHSNYDSAETTGPNFRAYAFVGDSFAAGTHGGQPWIPALRDRMQEKRPFVQMYNLGVEGTGLSNFRSLLLSVARKTPITDIIIIATSNDFNRPEWDPVVSGNEIRFCRKSLSRSECFQRPPTAYVIKKTATDEEILQEVVRLRKELRSYKSPQNMVNQVMATSTLVLMLKHIVKATFHLGSGLDHGLSEMKRIRMSFPNVNMHFIHLPQKVEIATGSYEIDVGDEIENLGIRYFPALKHCRLSLQSFYELDGHPNQTGYRQISECIGKHLGLY